MKNILYRVSKNTNGILHRYYTINREVHEKGLLSVHIYLYLSIYLSIYICIYISLCTQLAERTLFRKQAVLLDVTRGEFRGVAQSHKQPVCIQYKKVQYVKYRLILVSLPKPSTWLPRFFSEVSIFVSNSCRKYSVYLSIEQNIVRIMFKYKYM